MNHNHIYLIKNQVFGSDIKYPTKNNNDYRYTLESQIEEWRTSLVKLECSQSELDKIKQYFQYNSNMYFKYIKHTPVDITSITTVKKHCIDNCHLSLTKKCICPDYKVYFKEVESESQEQLLSELTECIMANKNGLCSAPTILKKYKITRND